MGLLCRACVTPFDLLGLPPEINRVEFNLTLKTWALGARPEKIRRRPTASECDGVLE
ncbi:hypothetical protein D1BOALGB6SA_37 [Olavius sp. associated proteobacterium Delta 1]|nr:hypothetical protein D1BOALGB6SA_37 [Olavius sp. associated proteobacterium Delta 1]